MMQDTGMLSRCKEKFVHIFSFAFLYLVPLFADDKLIKVPTLDSAYIKSHLDSLLENQSSFSLEYHLMSFNEDKNESYYKIIDEGIALILWC